MIAASRARGKTPIIYYSAAFAREIRLATFSSRGTGRRRIRTRIRIDANPREIFFFRGIREETALPLPSFSVQARGFYSIRNLRGR